MLPNFLGIGVPKAGTTWLHRLLSAHPDVWVPERKEVHFFDQWQARGLDWYESVFSEAESSGCRRVGEITPHYLYAPQGASRIAKLGSVDRMIVIFRDPVDRAHSHYWFRVRVENYQGTFEEFLVERPEAIEWGCYAKHLAPFLAKVPDQAVLALIYETALAEPGKAAARVGKFLDIDPAGFTVDPSEKVNKAFLPRRKRAYAAAAFAGRFLVRADATSIVGWVKRSKAFAWLAAPSKARVPNALTAAALERLCMPFEADSRHLEDLIGVDLSHWRDSWRRKRDEVGQGIPGSAAVGPAD